MIDWCFLLSTWGQHKERRPFNFGVTNRPVVPTLILLFWGKGLEIRTKGGTLSISPFQYPRRTSGCLNTRNPFKRLKNHRTRGSPMLRCRPYQLAIKGAGSFDCSTRCESEERVPAGCGDRAPREWVLGDLVGGGVRRFDPHALGLSVFGSSSL